MIREKKLKGIKITGPVLLCMLFLLFLASETLAATCYSIRSGNWDDPNTWANGLVPGKSNKDDAIISSGTTVIVNIKINGTKGKKKIFPIGTIIVEPNAKLVGDGTGSSEMNFGTDKGEDLINHGIIDFTGSNKTYFNVYKSSKWGGSGLFYLHDLEITNGSKLTFTRPGEAGTPANFTINIAGEFVIKQGDITASPTVAFNFMGTKQQILPNGNVTFSTVYINNLKGVLLAQNLHQNNLTGNLHVQSGELITGSYSLEGNRNNILSVAAGATLNLGTTQNIYNGFPSGFKEVQLHTQSNVHYSAESRQTIFPIAYGNLRISGRRSGQTVVFPDAANFPGYDVTVTVRGDFLPEASFSTGQYMVQGSTIHFAGTGTQTIPAFEYYNLKITGDRGANQVILAPKGTVAVAHAFAPEATFTTGGYQTANNTFLYNGAGEQVIQPFSYFNLTSGSTGRRVLSEAGTIQIAGEFNQGGNEYAVTNHTIEFNGTAPQVLPVFKYQHLIVSGGSDKTVVNSHPEVFQSLLFKGSKIVTGSNRLVVHENASVDGASAAGYVVGTMERYFSSGSSVSRRFEIGDGTQYLPVLITFPEVSSAGSMAITFKPGDHPQIIESCLDETRSLNAYWAVETSSGLHPLSYEATVTFGPGMLDTGTDIGKLTSALYNAGWQYPTVTQVAGSELSAIGVTGQGALLFGQVAVPLVVESPIDTAVVAGENAAFQVAASGKFLSYQWQVNKGTGWANILPDTLHSGATSPVLSLTSIPASLGTYQYRLVLSGACGPADTSAVASIQVNTYPVISLQPQGQTICPGNVAFTIKAKSLNKTGTELTFAWQASQDGGKTWAALTNEGIYSQTNSPSLTIAGATFDLNAAQYRCAVTGRGGLVTTSESALLTVLEPLQLVNSPLSATTCEGTPASFGVTGTGAGLSFQWQEFDGTTWLDLKENELFTGVNSNMLGITKTDQTLNGRMYRCVLTGDCAPSQIITEPVTLFITPKGTWIASTGTWDSSDNWCGGLPTAQTDVVVPAGELQVPGQAICRSLVLKGNASLRLQEGAVLEINEKIEAEGVLVVGSGKVILRGPAFSPGKDRLVTSKKSVLEVAGNHQNVVLPATVKQLKQLVLNHTSEVGLATDLFIDEALSFHQGKLNLNQANLVLSPNAVIEGADSIRYIITGKSPESGGFLVQQVKPGNLGPTVFPVGTAMSYAPARIMLSLASSRDNFRVRVVDDVFVKGSSGESGTEGVVIREEAVNKTWFIEEEKTGGSEATITLSWSVKEEGKRFRRTNSAIAHYTGEQWDYNTSFLQATPDNGYYSLSRVVTSFSPFAVVDNAVTNMTTVNTKLYLAGPFNHESGLMSNMLLSKGLLPLRQPFEDAPYNYSGSEEVTPEFLTTYPNIVDWVLLEIREGTGESTRLVRKACFIQTDGTILATNGSEMVTFMGVPSGNYYVLVHHRNHLPAMSGAPVNLTDNSPLYDFTLASTQYIGGLARQVGSNLYATHGGDANHDGRVDRTDVKDYWMPHNGYTGYLTTDFNLDGETDNVDSYIIWRPSYGAKIPPLE